MKDELFFILHPSAFIVPRSSFALMLGETRVQQLLHTALALSTADETEVSLSAADESLTRFANNAIHQNVADSDAVVEVRAVFGKRAGAASTNDFSPGSLARVVHAACESARYQPDNPDFPGLPPPRPVPAVQSFDDSAASASPDLRARAVGHICRTAAHAGAVAAGAYSTAAVEAAVANSRGLWAYHPSTSVDLTLVIAHGDRTGYAHGTSWRLDRVDTASITDAALRRALQLAGRPARRLPPGDYPVILEPYAVADIIESLAAEGMGALAVQEGRSWMNHRIGKPALSPLISIWDDGLDPLGEPQPFDCEGVPKQRVDIVRRGVPTAPVYDTHTAAREPGRVSTGHAQPVDEDWDGPMPANLHMAPGQSTMEDLIGSTERGLYITRFWYVNVVAEHDCVLTGMTRDGTFLVERGEIVAPVQDLRFTQALIPALEQTAAVGREARPVGGFYGSHRLPALKLDAFRFTG
ncbi:MAG: TldD/PmbA family protein [Chloroflexi bacterium]|nr:TldD/PmbA family protein [Chloroflexota bacterium]